MRGVVAGMPEIVAFKDKWGGQLNEAEAQIDEMAVFPGGSWFRSWMECV